MLWTDREEALLIRKYPLGDWRDLVLLFRGRSWNAIQKHASRLGIKRPELGVPWSDEKDALLIERYPLGDRQELMALLCDRSWCAIQCHAYKLGLKIQGEVLPEGFKRCSGCNEVKPEEEFYWDRSRRRPWCKACDLEYGHQRHIKNPEKKRERERQRYAENPEPYNIKTAARRSKARVTAGDLVLTAPQWRQILADWGYHCIYCANTEEYCIKYRGGKLVREHVLPDSQGGLFTAANIAPACPKCNGRKGPRTPEQAGMQIHWELYDAIGVAVAPSF